MNRQRVSAVFLFFLGLTSAVGAAPPATTTPAAQPDPTGVAILQALSNNPVTAPYNFAVAIRDGKYALSGRVGTKYVHDAAIRTLIALGYPVRDDLTIDTLEGNRAAARQAQAQYATGMAQNAPQVLTTGGVPYVYPPPLLGRLDNPFYGLEPPPVSYAPWYGAMAARREPINLAALNGLNPAAPVPLLPSTTAAPVAAPGSGVSIPNGIDMTLDSRGVATLRGTVPTLADRVAVGQEIARTPGITEVVNLLNVGGAAVAQAQAVPNGRLVSETPPPPPTPALISVPDSRPAPRDPNAARPAEGTSIVVDNDPLARRVGESIAHRPALASAPIRVSNREGAVTLSGKLASPYEAMLAFRAAQQTPGVREVVDRLEFPIPDVDRPNPLRDKGRPEDVEPYLLAQIRRQVGDLAHVDLVRVRGDALEVRGTVSRADDVPRVEAALRSIPMVRGFRLEPTFLTD